MSTQYRLAEGGLIDRSRRVVFSVDGKPFSGFKGDTLASALLANGQRLVGRSFKYHRPRGILTAGSEEPNALFEIREGARREPNTRATTQELYEGLVARSQNRFPSLKLDLMAANDLLSPFFGAGFYYKTFMWPASFWEKVYEPIIRRAAGLGALSKEPDPDTYEKGWTHCDLLVIGSGPAGLISALIAARSGARTILAEEDFELGGRINSETLLLNDDPANQWKAAILAELATLDNVRIMPRTTIIGAYDGGTYGALERVSDHLREPLPHQPKQRLWHIVAKRTILAAGAMERPIAFANNDRPGIMMGSAIRTYLNRFATSPGKSTIVFTCNDDGWKTATDLLSLGCHVEAVVDTRPAAAVEAVRNTVGDTPVFTNTQIINTSGRLGLESVTLQNARGTELTLTADCLAVCGGWNPVVNLTCHMRGRPAWNAGIAAFIPGDDLPPGMSVTGSANGIFATGEILADATRTTEKALQDLAINPSRPDIPTASDTAGSITAFFHVTPNGKKSGKGRAWLDFQNDVTVKDVELAHRENFRSVEHLKRYTTLGMATDQGKTSNLGGLAIMAELTGKTIPETGTTIFRPPYTPVALAAFAGPATGKNFQPYRLPPSHQWAEEQNAVFVEAGQWLRAQWFPKPGETHWRESVDREVLATRGSVGVCDVSTLGKVDVQGRDAADFLNRVYANGFAKLPVGKTRYGLMLREDGFVMDDGTAARLAENHFVVTTTTANAALVMRHMEFCAQVLWPELDVHLVSSTDQFAQYAIAGPNSRNVLKKLVDAPFDISNDAFGFMACSELTICGGIPARLFRISFSGELAYELAVSARYGDALMRTLMLAGAEFDITPYGTEALSVMRIEKGHPVGSELNGQTTAADLGMAKMVSSKKDSIGTVNSKRPALKDNNRPVLVGLKPVNPEHSITAGSHFIGLNKDAVMENDEGHMTSVAYSPNLKSHIGLGLVKNGSTRIGETIRAVDLVRNLDVEVEICSPHFIDPEGERLRG